MQTDRSSGIPQGFVRPCSVSTPIEMLMHFLLQINFISRYINHMKHRFTNWFISSLSAALFAWISHSRRTHKAFSQADFSRSEGKWRMVRWDRGEGCSPAQRRYRNTAAAAVWPHAPDFKASTAQTKLMTLIFNTQLTLSIFGKVSTVGFW